MAFHFASRSRAGRFFSTDGQASSDFSGGMGGVGGSGGGDSPRTSRDSGVQLVRSTPVDAELLKVIKQVREKHPNYGASRMVSAIVKRRPDWNVTESHVRRMMIQNGLNLKSRIQAILDEKTGLKQPLDKAELVRDPLQAFELLSHRGDGNFGKVYKAIHKKTKQIVAIKKIWIEKKDASELMTEISIMRECESKYIVRLYENFVFEGVIWIVMEYCSAGSISDIMEVCQTTLTEDQIACVVKDVLYGLAYCHQHELIHRDIKAANIVLNAEGQSKLVDLGASAKLDSSGKRYTLTGTPYWIAPEVVLERGYGVGADIWSLGITCIEIFDGVPPNSGTQPLLAMYRTPSKPPPTFQDPTAPSKLFQDFVRQCLIKDPTKRPSAGMLLDHRFIRGAKKASKVLKSLVTEAIEKLEEKYDSPEVEESFEFVVRRETQHHISTKKSHLSVASNQDTGTVVIHDLPSPPKQQPHSSEDDNSTAGAAAMQEQIEGIKQLNISADDAKSLGFETIAELPVVMGPEETLVGMPRPKTIVGLPPPDDAANEEDVSSDEFLPSRPSMDNLSSISSSSGSGSGGQGEGGGKQAVSRSESNSSDKVSDDEELHHDEGEESS